MNKKGFVQLVMTPLGMIVLFVYLLIGVMLSWSVTQSSYDFILDCPDFVPDDLPEPKDPDTDPSDFCPDWPGGMQPSRISWYVGQFKESPQQHIFLILLWPLALLAVYLVFSGGGFV